MLKSFSFKLFHTLAAVMIISGATLIPNGAMAANLPGTTDIKVPKMKVTAIDDLDNTFKATLFKDIQNYPERMALMPNGQAEAVFRTYLIKTKGHLILMDTGWGKTGARKGQTLDILAKKGIKPENITDIVMTHLDLDHVNGLKAADGPAFPKATIHISQPEFEGWLVKGDARVAKTVAICQEILKPYANNIKVFKYDQEILPGIIARDASGHTVGHTLYELGGAKGLAIVGDLLHVEPLQLRFTQASSRFDMNPAKAASMREYWLNKLKESQHTIAGMHFKSIGKVEQHPQGGYRIVKK